MIIVQDKLGVDKTLSDDELFTLMSLKDEDEKGAKKAFDIFYERYARLLWTLCYNACSWYKIADRDTVAKEIFWATMMQVYERPYYDSSKAKVSTWMFAIVKRVTYSLINSGGNDHLPLKEDMDVTSETIDDLEEGFVLPERRIIEEALDALSDLERDVLGTYFRYQCGDKHLPDDVLQELATYHGKTTVNIRQIKKRALDKVENHIRQNSDLLS